MWHHVRPDGSPTPAMTEGHSSPADVYARGDPNEPRRTIRASEGGPVVGAGIGVGRPNQLRFEAPHELERPRPKEEIDGAVRLAAAELKGLAGDTGIPSDAFAQHEPPMILLVVATQEDRTRLIEAASSPQSLLSAVVTPGRDGGLLFGGLPLRVDVGQLSLRSPIEPSARPAPNIQSHGAGSTQTLEELRLDATLRAGARELVLLAGDLGIRAGFEPRVGGPPKIRILLGSRADQDLLVDFAVASPLAFSSAFEKTTGGEYRFGGIPVEFVLR